MQDATGEARMTFTIGSLEATAPSPAGRAGSRPGLVVHLRRDDTLSLDTRRAAVVVRCSRGTVLVTQEGDLQDHVLTPGDELQSGRGGRVAVWALEEGDVAVRRAGAS
jgi:hypothetical protein